MSLSFASIWLVLPALLQAQTGSPDVFLDALAGPYMLSVSVKSPLTIPGVAEVEIRSATKDVTRIRLHPSLVSGSAGRFASSPEAMEPSKQDPKFFTASLLLMAPGSWKVRVQVDGGRGPGEAFVAIPAAMRRTLTMDFALGVVLASLGLVLVIGAVTIAGAGIREGQLAPGAVPSRARRVDAWPFMILAAAVSAGVMIGGAQWWNSEASQYERQTYKPLSLKVDVDPDGNLVASLANTGWILPPGDLLPDHGYFMRMYIVRVPAMDKIFYLHPDMQVAGVFTAKLPSMETGRYQFFGDIVHAGGFPETVTAEWELISDLRGPPLEGDDSQASAPPVGRNPDPAFSVLSGKYRMIMVRGDKPMRAHVASHLGFRVESKSGRPAEDLELYMGMPAYATIIRYGRGQFVQLDPMGSTPMVTMGLPGASAALPTADRSSHSMNMGVSPEITFPYRFSSPGDYRIFVRIKRAGKIETGVFDLNVVE